ncbi:MAG: hypothetical protein CFE30_06805 [Bradyrhizobium sp. PARBB1]|jgi:hypothetical protein|nr:MAG: hypothetical protein CFE30_06805 [Bradyrhizobium sp. PARBB1]HAQ83872.1 hypothetical protein [Bradyrhizobium sp.]HAR28085.1 hypothetical protein [Bradyrhizobium sp.]HBY30906.1 hypothetical protein [Bradyrhizobium sp.]
MRLSAFLEAWVQLVLQEGNRIVPKWDQKSGLLVRQQGVTELKRLIKWPKPPRNLGRAGASVARQARSRALEVAARL